MKKLCSTVLLVLWFMILLPSCATIQKADVKTIDEGAKVSKTVQHERAMAGAKKGLKRKVAIARFTNETRYGQGFFLDENRDRIGKQALDILSAKLVETERFILLERADLNQINRELTMEDFEPLKNMADYLIVGSVTEFGRRDQGQVGIFSRTKRQTAFAKVRIRLIEVRTGQILYAEEGDGEAFSEAGSVFGVGGRAGYDSAINDRALDAAITHLASNIIENLLDRPWRSYILGFDQGQLIMAGGHSQNISTGDVFQVMREGRRVKNPQTNMVITLPGTAVGKIRAVMSLGDTPESEVTLCHIIEGDFSEFISADNYEQLFVQEN